MKANSHGSRCQGRTKSRKPCRAAATEGGLCYFHANPNKASELGRIGGRKNRRVPADAVTSLPTLDSALAVRDAAAQVIADVYAGKLNPRIASSLSPLLSLQLRAIETSELERRLAALEKRFAKDGAKEEARADEAETSDSSGGLRVSEAGFADSRGTGEGRDSLGDGS